MPARPPVPAVIAGLLATVIGASACSPGAAPASPAGASAPAAAGGPTSPAATTVPSATASPEGALDHPTGPADVVLRVDLVGGFVRMETIMARVPPFTLYGDGRVLLLPADEGANPANPGGPNDAQPGVALREARLDEAQVQSLLAYALAEGGLGLAGDAYGAGIMDAATTTFEIHAGGVDKVVRVDALAPDPEPGPDAAVRAALAGLEARLRSLTTTADYVPDGFVAVLAEVEADPVRPADPWPWPALTIDDFAQPADDDPVPFPSRMLTPAEAGAAAGPVPAGGLGNLRVAGPDGRVYALVLRPALPDDLPPG